MVLTAAVVGCFVLLAGGLYLAAGSTGLFGQYGCTHGDRELAEQMAKDPALEALPGNYERLNTPESHCDDDDRVAASRAVFRTGQPWARTLAEVSAVLEENGWRPVKDGESPCLTRDLDGDRVIMRLYNSDPDRRYSEADLTMSQFGFTDEQARCDDWY